MKALRIALAVLAGAVVLLIIVAVIAIRSFDLNDYKDEVAAYVEERTGRTLTIENNIEFSLFPWFAVETGGVSLSDDPAFGDRSFVRVDSLSARVRVWPLLKRRVEIGRVILDGIDLNLGMDAQRRGNWSSLLEIETPEAPAADLPAPERPAIDALAVEGIELRNARILWRDAAGEVVAVVRDLNLVTGPVDDDEPVDVMLSLSLLDVASQASVAIELETVVAARSPVGLGELEAEMRLFDAREQERGAATLSLASVRLAGNTIRTGPAVLAGTVQRPPLGPASLEIEVALAAVELDLDSGNLLVSGLGARTGDLDASVELRGEALLSDPRLSGTLALESDSLTTIVDLLGIEPGAVLPAGGTGGLRASASFDLGLAARTVAVDRFTVAVLGLEASGEAGLDANGTLAARIDVPAFSPNEPLLGLLRSWLPEGVDPGAVSSAALNASLAYESQEGRLEVSAVSLTLDSATLEGQLAMDDLRSPRGIDGALTATGLDNRLLGALLGVWLPAPLVETDLGDFRLATEFGYAPDTGTAEFAPLELSAYGLAGEGQLTLVAGEGVLQLSGRASLAEFSPVELLTRFRLPAPQTADPGVFRSAELAASFETRGSNGEFRDIAIRLDDSRITGELSVENFADPAYEFLLRADRIDVDRYLPPTREAAAEADTDGTERLVGDMRIASEPLSATLVNGLASVGHLRIGGMEFEQLETGLAFGNSRAALSPVRTELYGGTFRGGLTIDATDQPGSVRLQGTASEVAMRPLLEAMLGGAHFGGTGDVELDLNGRGDTIDQVLESAAGSLELALADGELDGINLGHELCEAVNARRGLPAPAGAPEVTRYSVIRGSATISDGIASSSDLYAATGYLELTGRGNMRIVDQRIDQQFRAAMTGAIPIAGCEDLNRTIANDPIPINFTLTGQLPDVEVGFDLSQLLEDWARRELRQRTREEAGERLEDALRDLFD